MPAFFAEIRRVLRPGGVHRISVPDFAVQARRYLASFARSEADARARAHHDAAVAKLLGPVVRREASGTSRQRPLRRRVENLLLGGAGRRGEIHMWGWDRVNLRQALEDAGFRDVQVVDWQTSRIPNWQQMGLDRNGSGEHKPGSLYVESLR